MTLLSYRSLASALLASACLGQAAPALAQTSPYLGQVMCGAFNFAPKGWALMNGQLMSISQNTALFALLGTTYGGDGQSTFALPDLRGRMPVHFGQGPGLTNRPLGDHGGSETVSLNPAQLPPHTHAVAMLASTADATSTSPVGHVPAKSKQPQYGDPTALAYMAPATTGSTGSAAPIDKVPPYLALNCMIAITGTFPMQN